MFSSAGIAETYFKKAGIDIVVANELLQKRGDFYQKMYPASKMIVGDIKEKKEEFLNSITDDIKFLIATPPCQGLSTLGMNKHLTQMQSDPRNYLVFDILDVIEKYNDYTLLASHSNVRKLCNRDRNLDDEELMRLRDMNGYISLFTNSNFLSLDNKKMNYRKRQKMYIKHLDYLIDKIGFPIDKILIATDDMNFHPSSIYHNAEAFPIESIFRDLYMIISDYYDEYLASNILIDNPKKLINKVKKI